MDLSKSIFDKQEPLPQEEKEESILPETEHSQTGHNSMVNSIIESQKVLEEGKSENETRSPSQLSMMDKKNDKNTTPPKVTLITAT